MGEFKNLLLEKNENGVLIVKINRPSAMNALNTETLEELNYVFTEVIPDPSVRAIVLTGEGKAFIAGADIAEMKEKNSKEGVLFSELGQKFTLLVEKAPQPVIAAVNGYALGGGTEMAIACDFIYASEKATFGQPEVGLGIIPGYGATVRLAQFVGLPRALEMICTGRFVKAEEAYSWGLVNKVCKPENLLPEVLELAHKIVQNSPGAVKRSKELVYSFAGHSELQDNLKKEAEAFGNLFGSHDQKEGMGAFIEKRKPKFEELKP